MYDSLQKPDVELVNRALGIAVLSNGVQIEITTWLDDAGECAPEHALSCVAKGPDETWWAIDLSGFSEATIN